MDNLWAALAWAVGGTALFLLAAWGFCWGAERLLLAQRETRVICAVCEHCGEGLTIDDERCPMCGTPLGEILERSIRSAG
jgi:hypothetical protein